MYWLQVINAVERNCRKVIKFRVEADQEPAVIVLLDIIWMNGPDKSSFVKFAVVNFEGLLADNGVKNILQPINAGIPGVILIVDYIAHRSLDGEFVFLFADQRIHPGKRMEALEALEGLDVLLEGAKILFVKPFGEERKIFLIIAVVFLPAVIEPEDFHAVFTDDTVQIIQVIEKGATANAGIVSTIALGQGLVAFLNKVFGVIFTHFTAETGV